jgi:hypothetical protein
MTKQSPLAEVIMSVPMTWEPLHDRTADVSETHLQRIFDDWHSKRDDWHIAGAPDWLLRCGQPVKRRSYDAKNFTAYHFTPDVLWQEPEFLVMELKRGNKYEPIALAEALHHAWVLGEALHLEQPAVHHAVPVIVGSSSDGAWLRGALAYLFHYGLKGDRLRYLEASYLRTMGGTSYLWLEDPFAEWTPGENPPPCIPSAWLPPACVWCGVSGSNSWAGVLASENLSRPRVPQTFVFISQVANQEQYLTYIRKDGNAGDCYIIEPNIRAGPKTRDLPPSPFVGAHG